MDRPWYRWRSFWVHWALVLPALMLGYLNRHSSTLFVVCMAPLLVDLLVAPVAVRPMVLAAKESRGMGGFLGTFSVVAGLGAMAVAAAFLVSSAGLLSLVVSAALGLYGLASCWVGAQLVFRHPDDLDQVFPA